MKQFNYPSIFISNGTLLYDVWESVNSPYGGLRLPNAYDYLLAVL